MQDLPITSGVIARAAPAVRRPALDLADRAAAMADDHWRAAYLALALCLAPDDVLLAPRGRWPPFGARVQLYDDLIEPGACDVFLLHKSRVGGMPKAVLARIAREWQWIFANEVFVAFARSGKRRLDARLTPMRRHCRSIMDYLRSADRRRRRSRILYVHTPKTGGTAMWDALSRALPSHIYYASAQACWRNPPAAEDYDLVGVHFTPEALGPWLREDDIVLGLVREPTERFLSFVRHVRRPGEDVDTFTPPMKAVRELPVTQVLREPWAMHEVLVQLVVFAGRPAGATAPEELLHDARVLAFRPNVWLAPTERSDAFADQIRQRLGLRLPSPGRLNASGDGSCERYEGEFTAARELLFALNHAERLFYDEVRTAFAARAPE